MSYKLKMLMATEPIGFIDVIEHTKDNLDFVSRNRNEYENLDALIVNIKNSLAVINEDIKTVNRDDVLNYITHLKRSKDLMLFIINKGITNVKSLLTSLPKDNYDSMSKEELIALLREKQ